MTNPGHARFTDAMGPRLVSEARTFAAVPTGPVRRAPLRSASRLLGWVWTDGVAAAGWEPGEQTPEAVRAGAAVWAVHAAAAREGAPVTVVLEPERYQPGYALGEPS